MPQQKNTYYFLPKLFTIYLRVVDYFRLFPRRLYRFLKYFFRGIWRSVGILFSEGLGNVLRNRPLQKIMYWTGEVVVSFLELLGVGEIYETITDFSKPKTRPLHFSEIEMAKSIFGNAINYRRVRVDESAHLGPKQQHFCYVSFYIINSWGKMHDSTLIHELVHVWQYENMGAIYIPRALWAQTTREGYDYGGVEMLLSFLSKNKTLYDFNLEQQGDIVADYFRIKNGYAPHWGNGTEEDLPIYERFCKSGFQTRPFVNRVSKPDLL